MDEPRQKRTRVEREEWAKRVERWHDSGLTAGEFAAELGINPKTLMYWAWSLKREAAGKKRQWTARRQPAAPAPPKLATQGVAAFVELPRQEATTRFELEVRGRRLHIPSAFDAQQLRASRGAGERMIPSTVRIFVCTEPIDMRQGFDRLAQLVGAGSAKTRSWARSSCSPIATPPGSRRSGSTPTAIACCTSASTVQCSTYLRRAEPQPCSST